MFKEFDVLEGSGNAEMGDLVRAGACDVVFAPVVVDDFSFLRFVESANAVEQAGLARAIGTDDGEYFTLLDFQPDVEQRRDAAEAQLNILDVKLCIARLKLTAVEGVSESAQHIRR